MKISPVNFGYKNNQIHFQKKIKKVNEVTPGKTKAKFKKALPFIFGATLGLAGLGAGILIGAKNNKIQGKINNKNTKDIMLALLALGGYGIYTKNELDSIEINQKLDEIKNGKAPSQQALKSQGNQLSELRRTQTNPTLNKHAGYFHDILLLKQNNALNKNSQKYAKAIDFIQNIGYEKLTSSAPVEPLTKQNPTIWSITSEFAPIKEGGLGSVPPEIRNNAEKIGVNMPTFVPMYLNEGISTLESSADFFGDKTYTYTYKGKQMPLKKLATINLDVYKNGIAKSIPVNYFLYEDKDSKGTTRQLIFIHANDYFDGTIYEGNSKTEEPEKFALMSKAVYEFAKIKLEGLKATKEISINDTEAFKSVKAPDGMILNDWQASPTAALLRYKSAMENAYSQLSDETAQKLKNMRLITIGHNATYQGSTQNNNDYYQKKASTSNILNTLFDKYAYDIVLNAQLKASSTDEKDEGLKALDNVLVMEYQKDGENYTNFLNMGIVLSDYFNPVSQNYANELISPQHPELSYALQWALTQKAKAGKLIGVINGNDFNNLSIEAKAKQIKQTTGLDFETYQKTSSIEEIKQKRFKNKINLYQNFALPFSHSGACSNDEIKKVEDITSRLEFCEGAQGTNLPILTKEELEETPILMSGGRLVSQKGMDVLCDAIKILFDNWEKDFKGHNKPIFYIAGADGEGGIQRKIIEDLKDKKLSKEDNDRILFAHGFAPMAGMMAGADYFLMPSKFEPCGLTQGESLALGTPVIASAVGGIVDTINRDGKFNGVLTDKNKPLDAQEFYEAIKKGLEIYYNQKSTYTDMVKDSIDEDFSWIKEGKTGPVYDYLELFGINRNSLNS